MTSSKPDLLQCYDLFQIQNTEKRSSFATLLTDLRALAPDHGLWAHIST